jgi:hypothetical protein
MEGDLIATHSARAHTCGVTLQQQQQQEQKRQRVFSCMCCVLKLQANPFIRVFLIARNSRLVRKNDFQIL